jgi:hypothetical protein
MQHRGALGWTGSSRVLDPDSPLVKIKIGSWSSLIDEGVCGTRVLLSSASVGMMAAFIDPGSGIDIGYMML